MKELQRMREPCPVCGCVLTDSMDWVARWEKERRDDPEGARDRLITRLRESGMDGLAARVEDFNAEPIPDPQGELDSLYAHLRGLVAATEVGDWRHAVKGLLPEGFEFDAAFRAGLVFYSERERAQEGRRVTHGRHCPCSACAAQDWTDPKLACCGMHGPSCPPIYAPIHPDTDPALFTTEGGREAKRAEMLRLKAIVLYRAMWPAAVELTDREKEMIAEDVAWIAVEDRAPQPRPTTEGAREGERCICGVRCWRVGGSLVCGFRSDIAWRSAVDATRAPEQLLDEQRRVLRKGLDEAVHRMASVAGRLRLDPPYSQDGMRADGDYLAEPLPDFRSLIAATSPSEQLLDEAREGPRLDRLSWEGGYIAACADRASGLFPGNDAAVKTFAQRSWKATGADRAASSNPMDGSEE